MHNFLLSKTNVHQKIDHKDNNGLNNQKDNLRLCSHAQNMANKRMVSTNKSGYRGVSWHKASQGWVAQITILQKKIYLGSFKVKEEAARTYDKAAKEHFGEFARLNNV